MTHKRAETFTRAMLKHYGYYWHKYGDVRYCINCHHPLPKSENAPDFAAGFCYTYIEAKNSTSDGTWRWVEIAEGGTRANQRKWLIENGGWLFIELGEGTAPKGKSAYLVPFSDWTTIVEPTLNYHGLKSIRKEAVRNRPGADEFLAPWRLTWDQGKWLVPNDHVWWTKLLDNLKTQLIKVEGIINGATGN